VEPADGDVACGENGQGKLAAVEVIVQAVLETVRKNSLYEGKRVVVSAGPTYEPIDSVRYMGNRSSGKMGIALARAARQMGADVTLILGPTALNPPPFIEVIRVSTAAEMLGAVLSVCQDAHIFIGSAAVADFRSKETLRKIAREGELHLDLVATEDIVAAAKAKFTQLTVIAFSAEESENVSRGREKLKRKGADAIVVNDISRADIGFNADANEGTLLFSSGEELKLQKQSKFNFAWQILEAVRGVVH
jgi:phosphopantothenoylcysteine decarboxylase/phosphopantothenate--cysteine ligase